MGNVIEQLSCQGGSIFHTCYGSSVVNENGIVMIGVWDNTGMSVGWEEGGWIAIAGRNQLGW